MKRIVIALLLSCTFVSCTTTIDLYNWGAPINDSKATRYEELSYKNYDEQTPESICELLCLYDYLINNPGGSRGVVPPGIFAEYGYLLLKPETAIVFAQYATIKQKSTFGNLEDYSSLFGEKGLYCLEQEMQLYPESVVFITPLLNNLKNN